MAVTLISNIERQNQDSKFFLINSNDVDVSEGLEINSNFGTGDGSDGTSLTKFVKDIKNGTLAAGKVNSQLKVGSKAYDGSQEIIIEASDLGLANALHFIGIKDDIPTDTNYTDGDVILVNGKEYVYNEGAWIELGDESSYALKTISVTGTNGLTGTGTLEGNVTLSHDNTSDQTSISAADRTYISGITLDDYGHVTALTTAQEVMSNAGTILVDLSSDNAVTYTNGGDIIPGVTGILDAANGGTGNTTGRVQIGQKEGETLGTNATSEGSNTIASGNSSHAEGSNTKASGAASHAEGGQPGAEGGQPGAEAIGGVLIRPDGTSVSVLITEASGASSHAEGYPTRAEGKCAHSEGSITLAQGNYSHAEGNFSASYGQSSHAEGNATRASGGNSHAEGYYTTASGGNSHAEGKSTTASGGNSHAEGVNTTASGGSSHAEGNQTTASGDYAHAQGDRSEAQGYASFAGGSVSLAIGKNSTALGKYTVASGENSSAFGAGATDSIILTGESNSTTYTVYATESYEYSSSTLTMKRVSSSGSITNITVPTQPTTQTTSSSTPPYGSTYGTTTVTDAIVITLAPGFKYRLNYSHSNTYLFRKYNQASQYFSNPISIPASQEVDLRNAQSACYLVSVGRQYTFYYRHSMTQISSTQYRHSYSSAASNFQNFSIQIYRYVPSSISNIENLKIITTEGLVNIVGYNATAHTINTDVTLSASSSVDLKYFTVIDISKGAIGQNSFSIGNNTTAEGIQAFASGTSTIASGANSFAEGVSTTASGQGSHAEGNRTIARGNNSHAEGEYTEAFGKTSHAEGGGTVTLNELIDAYNTTFNTNLNIATITVNDIYKVWEWGLTQGDGITIAAGNYSHAEGYETLAGNYSHAEGIITAAKGERSHAEGMASEAFGKGSHSEGGGSVAYSDFSHAEGGGTYARGKHSHAEGLETVASGTGAHSEGFTKYYSLKLTGSANSLEYTYNDIDEALGTDLSFLNEVVGVYIIYTKDQSWGRMSRHKVTACTATTITLENTLSEYEDISNVTCHIQYAGAHGSYSHTEGFNTRAMGQGSHAEGINTCAVGEGSHAGGFESIANDDCSFVHGEGLITQKPNQAIFGKYNATSESDLFIIGNGSSDDSRSNAFAVDEFGIITLTDIDDNRGTLTATEYSGNAATATKATQDGSGNTITDTYVPLAGGTMTGSLKMSQKSLGYYLADSSGTSYPAVYDNGSNLWIGATQTASKHHVGGTYISAGYDASTGKGKENIYMCVPNDDNTGGTPYQIWRKGNSVTGAVWNDYAECRESDCYEAGYVLSENGDDTLSKSIKRLAPFAGVSSDTWGFSQGETEKAKTHIAVAGRVLAYPYQDRNNYKPGDCVCAAPGGTVDIMTREEIREWPDRIVGTVSCVPQYEEWGGGQGADRPAIKVNGRIWIKVK